jgi:3-oxoacyl-(acyl-carrier-protein) synthase
VAAPHRVVVTGVGVLSSLGLDTASFWSALAEGRSGIGPIRASVNRLDASAVRFENVAEVSGFEPSAFLEAKEISFMDRFAQLAVDA